MAQVAWSNCPDAIRAQANRFSDDLCRVMVGNLVGVYLHGSLAMGCLNPDRSDLDLLVVSQAGLSQAERRGLAVLALEASRNPLPLEFSVVQRAALAHWRHPAPYEFHFSEDWRDRMAAELATGGGQMGDGERLDHDLAAHVTITRHRGIGLYGEPVAAVIPNVPRADYVDSILRDFDWARERIADNPVYAVLNFCRIYGYLLNGQISSKDEAGQWALYDLPEIYRPLMQNALAVYRGQVAASFDTGLLADFAAYMHDQIQRLV